MLIQVRNIRGEKLAKNCFRYMGIAYRSSVDCMDTELVVFKSANYLGTIANPFLYGYSDANFSLDIDTRRCTSGYIFMLAVAPILWQSRAQATVAFSSTEAEYIAFVGASQEAI